MKTKDEKLSEVLVLWLIGRTGLSIGLTMLLTHAFFGHPAGLARPLVGTVVGLLLLAGAASRLNDAHFLTVEIMFSVAFATILIDVVSIRRYFHRVPHGLSPNESVAAAACAAGLIGALVWLRRDRRKLAPE